MNQRAPLPIDEIEPALVAAIRATRTAVVQAPPGAGKTTRVPLMLLPEISGRILMLEPRRIAARAAAERLAEELGESAGERVGYRMRGASVPGSRIEVVTEGILTRMIQAEPDLPGVGCVIFDEFHERSIHADLGLALCLELQGALREDLALVVMSATLDAAPVAALMGDAPLVTSEGRAFPVETRHASTRAPAAREAGRAVAAAVREVLASETGSILCFLPGRREIADAVAALGDLGGVADVRPLHGGLPIGAQRAAIRAAGAGRRKVVLATSIAETSLTIEGVRVVIDAGLARRARFDAGSGMSRLVTERVSRAEADQRRGRAGRTQEGVCLRLWTRGEESAMPAQPPAEIEVTDLAPLALELARWGADDLPFPTDPPAKALAAARDLLRDLGALAANGSVTAHGKRMAAIPAHPRLAHMMIAGDDLGSGRRAAMIAGLLGARDAAPGTNGADLAARLRALESGGGQGAARDAAEEVRRLSRFARSTGGALSDGALLSLAYPDRIGLRREGDAPRYLLSGGKGATFAPSDALGTQRMIVAADLDGDPTQARIRLAAPVAESEIRALHGERILPVRICEWSRRYGRVEARERSMLGAIALEDAPWGGAPAEMVSAAAVDGVRALGLGCLGWSKSATLLRARVEWLRAQGGEMPDMSDAALLASLEHWLAPHLGGVRDAGGLGAFDPAAALEAMLDWPARERLDRLAPAAFVAPTGTRCPIDYGAEGGPAIEVRLQEMFGLATHPAIGPSRVPLTVSLLSPARRPVQVTGDLPRFWSTSYADVRRDLRGRYPRHPWPEDPAAAEPTRRVKPRGS